MPNLLDANVLIRYFIGEPKETAERAQRLLDSDIELVITETAILETAYVLRSQYGRPREAVLDALVGLLQRANITVRGLDKDLVHTALLQCRPSGRINVGDALVWAAARQDSPAVVYSFNRRFPSQHIDLREP